MQPERPRSARASDALPPFLWGQGVLRPGPGSLRVLKPSPGVSPRAACVSLQATVKMGLDVSRSLAPQGPAYGVRRFSGVSGVGAGTEALRGQELRRVSGGRKRCRRCSSQVVRGLSAGGRQRARLGGWHAEGGLLHACHGGDGGAGAPPRAWSAWPPTRSCASSLTSLGSRSRSRPPPPSTRLARSARRRGLVVRASAGRRRIAGAASLASSSKSRATSATRCAASSRTPGAPTTTSSWAWAGAGDGTRWARNCWTPTRSPTPSRA